ncbi:hypothetical protein Poly30_08530 [Planctomycetes bacterium Poly30]|uniref:HEAT repeat protein n=1 Tax=Saltatorellus ferox TaxID=2528018 RepID=A0A518EMP8_9BACT|nr:hypothetical protein Poly30_08530 [Planctomycetes bacterium Poly30]
MERLPRPGFGRYATLALIALPLLTGAAHATPGPNASPQATEAPDAELQKKIDTFLGHARRGSAVIRPQAADRLVGLGEPAARRILEVAGETNEQLALLGTNLVEAFGAFENSESGTKLRQRLWPALEDSEFPWRPAAARGLSLHPQPSEKELFVRYLEDPIAPVRLAALDALYTLTEGAEGAARQSYLQHAVARLSDENDIVRREAALQLHARGHGYALLWLLEDMRRDDAFFGVPFGKMARYDAMRALMDRGIDLGEYNPELPPDTNLNRAGVAALEKRVREAAAKSEAQLPESERGLLVDGPAPIAQAAPPIQNAVIGLQLKSCRRGDYYLRWTADDVLVVGYGNPVRIQLATGTTDALVKAGKEAQAPLEDQVFWGRAGCDMEGYFLPRQDASNPSPLNLILAKNEEPMEGLRPAVLSEFGAKLCASIPSDQELSQSDPRTRELAKRVRAAFASIGGPVVH